MADGIGMLPSTINISGIDYPVNWTVFSTYSPNDLAGEDTYDIWIPVLPANLLKPSVIWQLMSYLYQTPTGKREFSPMEKVDIDVAGIKNNDIMKAASYASLYQHIGQKDMSLLGVKNISDYLVTQSNSIVSGREINPDYVFGEAKKISENPEYLYRLRSMGEAGGTGRTQEYENQFATSMQEGLRQIENEAPGDNEFARLRYITNRLKPMYDKYKAEEVAGTFNRDNQVTTSGQMTAAMMRIYEDDINRLHRIEAGEEPAQHFLEPTKAFVKRFLQPYVKGQQYAEGYQNLSDLRPENVESTALQIFENPNAPYPKGVTTDMFHQLYTIGGEVRRRNEEIARQRVYQADIEATEKSKQWQELVKKAREQKRVVSI